MKIITLSGDGIGPEIMAAAMKVFHTVADLNGLAYEIIEGKIGGAALDAYQHPYPEQTRDLVDQCDAVLLGAVGGPKWDQSQLRPEQGLLLLRKDLEAYCNMRPIKTFEALKDKTPLKDESMIDMCFVRELTGGIYFGHKESYEENGVHYAKDVMSYNSDEIRRISHIAFDFAKKRKNKVTLVDKSNVLETSKLWRKVVHEEKGNIEVENMYVDNAAMQLMVNPKNFDVILTSNMFGDILSDEASILAGSIGCLPSISMGNGPILYEPIHGSAPDIANQNIANPIGMIMSVAYLFKMTYKREDLYDLIYNQINQLLNDGFGTRDLNLKSTVTTTHFTEKLIESIKENY
ncbi:MAG: 3-isopropylmalate dehydrogenase [Clostridia bacterium]|nr:3-isopropylmalate dehydrogenase [Clostridia bacterium]